MRLLLDTHIFLWYITADPRLPASFREAARREEVTVEQLLRLVKYLQEARTDPGMRWEDG